MAPNRTPTQTAARFTACAHAFAIDSNGDRIDSYEVMNYVVEQGDVMRSVAVGMFNSSLQQYKAYEQAIVWPGESREVPADYFSGDP